MRTESANGIESRPEYRKWSADLSKTPLFKGLSADEVACLLLAMQPRVCEGRAERGPENGHFRVVVACDPPQPVSLGAHEYSMPRRFTPGMLMAEVSALAGVGSYQAAPAGLEAAFVPAEPCPWLGNSPLHMMTLGAMWLGQKLHPEVFSYDLEAEVGNFFELLYGIGLSHEEEMDILESGLDHLPDGDGRADAAVPDMELIAASSLNSAPANLRSGYQPPDPGPTTTCSYYAYVCIASDSVYGLGHAAAITRQMIRVGSTVTSDLMDLFSFYTDPLNYLSSISSNITDFYNILHTEEPGTVGHLRSDKTMEEGTVSTSYAWGSFMSNSEVSYSGSLGSFGSGSDVYDRIIGVQVSQTKYSAIRNGAIMCVLGSSNAPVSTDYQFVGNNCGDFALGILDECGDIAVNYNKASTIAWLRLNENGIASAILLDGQLSILQSALVSIVDGAIDHIVLSGAVPTIPNCIYEYFQNVGGSYIDSVDMRFRQSATSGWIV